jgi:hypothetical protein
LHLSKAAVKITSGGLTFFLLVPVSATGKKRNPISAEEEQRRRERRGRKKRRIFPLNSAFSAPLLRASASALMKFKKIG